MACRPPVENPWSRASTKGTSDGVGDGSGRNIVRGVKGKPEKGKIVCFYCGQEGQIKIGCPLRKTETAICAMCKDPVMGL